MLAGWLAILIARATLSLTPALGCGACVAVLPAIRDEAVTYGGMQSPARGLPADVQAVVLSVEHHDDRWAVRVSLTSGPKPPQIVSGRGKTLEDAGKAAAVRIVRWSRGWEAGQ
jgi:hypothetical protein